VIITVSVLLCVPLLFGGVPAPWPQGQLRVYDDSTGHSQEVRLAADVWNEAQTGVRLIMTDDRDAADVIVQTADSNADAVRRCNHGLPLDSTFSACADWVGYKPWGPSYIIIPAADREDQWAPVTVRLVAHELGHAIGLGHSSNPCSVMTPGALHCARYDTSRVGVLRRITPGCLPDVSAARRAWSCPVQLYSVDVCGPFSSDLERVQRMYGGRIIKRDPRCDIPLAELPSSREFHDMAATPAAFTRAADRFGARLR
jgi:hypothetical protein